MESNAAVEVEGNKKLHQRKRVRYAGEFTPRFFENCHAVFMWEGKKGCASKMKSRIIVEKFHEMGGWRSNEVDGKTTHLIANSFGAVLNHHWDCQKCPFRIQSQVKCVSYEWVSACLEARQIVPERFFRIDQGADVSSQLANFQEQCGIVKADGTWKYIPELTAFVNEEPLPVLEEIVKVEQPVPAPATETKFRYDLPPWISRPPPKNDGFVFGPPTCLDD